jgi:hypothetical protein
VTDSTPNNFWDRVSKSAPDECWEWQAARSSKGYGSLKFNGRHAQAHRIAFYFTHGRWPMPFCLHKCDNPPCVNPNHLEEGDLAENARQAKDRGLLRPRRGDNNGRAILKATDIPIIRQRLKAGDAPLAIARDFGVERPVIYQIKRGVNWTSVK